VDTPNQSVKEVRLDFLPLEGRKRHYTKKSTILILLKLAINIVHSQNTYKDLDGQVFRLRLQLRRFNEDYSRAVISDSQRVLSQGKVPDKHSIVATNAYGRPYHNVPWVRELEVVIGKLAGIMFEKRTELQASVDTEDTPDFIVYREWQRSVEKAIREYALSLKIPL
jgi:hypothetical protein